MTIVFVWFSVRPGGVASVMKLLVRSLVQLGINVEVLLDENNDEYFKRYVSGQVKTIKRPLNVSKAIFLKRTMSFFLRERAVFVGVQVNNTMWLAIARLAMINAPCIVSWEHSSPLTSIKKEMPRLFPLFLMLRFFLFCFIDGCLYVSKGAMKESLFITPPWIKSKDTPSPVYFEQPEWSGDKISRDIRKPNDVLHIVSIGRVSIEKGLHLALEALKNVNFNWFYTIVGDGPELNSLKSKVDADCKLKDTVDFTGWLDRPNRVLENSDVLLLPSYYEGMPTVLIEACLFSVPIIASNCKSGPAEIVNSKNGLLFNVGDEKDLSRKLNFFYDNFAHFKNGPHHVLAYQAMSASSKFIDNISEFLKK